MNASAISIAALNRQTMRRTRADRVAAQTASITSGNSYNVLPTTNYFLTISTEF